MCMRPRAPKPLAAAATAPPPPPPPPPAPTAETMADPGGATEARRRETEGYSQRAKRKGTSMLKIRLASNVGSGSGANVGY